MNISTFTHLSTHFVPVDSHNYDAVNDSFHTRSCTHPPPETYNIGVYECLEQEQTRQFVVIQSQVFTTKHSTNDSCALRLHYKPWQLPLYNPHSGPLSLPKVNRFFPYFLPLSVVMQQKCDINAHLCSHTNPPETLRSVSIRRLRPTGPPIRYMQTMQVIAPVRCIPTPRITPEHTPLHEQSFRTRNAESGPITLQYSWQHSPATWSSLGSHSHLTGLFMYRVPPFLVLWPEF